MKKLILTALIAIGLVVGAMHAGKAQGQLADFQMTIQPNSGKVKMECQKGCAWKILTFDCGSSSTCMVKVDNKGMAQ